MTVEVRVLDVVALTVDLPEQGLVQGQVGTIVEELAGGAFEVEFSDSEGRTYAMVAIRSEQLLPLHFEPGRIAS